MVIVPVIYKVPAPGVVRAEVGLSIAHLSGSRFPSSSHPGHMPEFAEVSIFHSCCAFLRPLHFPRKIRDMKTIVGEIEVITWLSASFCLPNLMGPRSTQRQTDREAESKCHWAESFWESLSSVHTASPRPEQSRGGTRETS